jgi:hypothetical protein
MRPLTAGKIGHLAALGNAAARCPWKEKEMISERASGTRSVLLALVMSVLPVLGASTAGDLDKRTSPGFDARLETAAKGKAEIMRQAFRVNYRMADRSLAVREQVDFLLTPALLVQEAISDDVVLTYPEE